MSRPFTILAIPGSLRKKSYNLGALRAAKQLAPEGVQIEIFELTDIPPYNQDLDPTPPARVIEFKAKIRASDAILIATPEYSFSMPGVLKNALDWACRPYGDSAWVGKPVAILGATPGAFGTTRAQHHLRQVLMALDMHTLNFPEVLIANAANRFDEDGNLTDEGTKNFIQKQILALVGWSRRLTPRNG